MQLIAEELGGRVGGGEYGGYADVTVDIVDEDDPLTGSLHPETRVWASHADEVKELPGFELTGKSDVCDVEAMSDTDRDLYGVQWHPEVAHTEAAKSSRTSSRSASPTDGRPVVRYFAHLPLSTLVDR